MGFRTPDPQSPRRAKPTGTGPLGQIGWEPQYQQRVSPGNPCLGPIAIAVCVYEILVVLGIA